MADQLLPLLQHRLQHSLHGLQQSLYGLQSHIEAVIHSQRFQDFMDMALQQWLAAASCVACLALVLATIAAGKLPEAPDMHVCPGKSSANTCIPTYKDSCPAGWVALWHTTMKDVGFFREIMGLNK